jgi:hypothetical protein
MAESRAATPPRAIVPDRLCSGVPAIHSARRRNSMGQTALTTSQRKDASAQIARARDFVKAIERMGGRVPSGLKTALERLQFAVDTGQDLADSAEQASKALAALEKDLLSACRGVDNVVDDVCAAGVTRQWQMRSVRFTLDYRNPKSVTSEMLRATLRRYVPAAICRYLDACARQERTSFPSSSSRDAAPSLRRP